MDNVTPPLVSLTACAIKLDQLQYTFYQQSRLEIHSPTGTLLTVISKPLSTRTDDDAIYQLWCQACLLEVLFDQIQGHVQLPQKAINSIVRIVDRIDMHLKKQIVK